MKKSGVLDESGMDGVTTQGRVRVLEKTGWPDGHWPPRQLRGVQPSFLHLQNEVGSAPRQASRRLTEAALSMAFHTTEGKETGNKEVGAQNAK